MSKLADSILAELADNPLYLHLFQMGREEELGHVLGLGADADCLRILVEALIQRRNQIIKPQLYWLLPPGIEGLEAQALKQKYQALDWVQLFPTPESGSASSLEGSGLTDVFNSGGIESGQRFDLVLIDGHEFGPSPGPEGQSGHLTRADFAAQALEALQGSGVLILAGVRALESRPVWQRLQQDPDYVLIQESRHWYQGVAVYKRRQALLPGLSVIVHTRNAEALLPDCLASVSWADELIVVDMQSTDGTLAVAELAGARVAHHLPVACVDEARNWGLSLVRYAWTLVLDADERLPQETRLLIEEILSREPIQASDQTHLPANAQQGSVAGYWLPRRNFFFGQEVSSLFPDYQLRLFRSQQAHWRGLVHELPTLNGTAGRFPERPEWAIQHYSYKDVADFCQRQLRYAQTLWQQLPRLQGDSSTEPAQQLRERFEARQQLLIEKMRTQVPDNLEWLVGQLYLFSQLAITAEMLQNSGQLQSSLPVSGRARLSAYSYIKNAQRFDYPFIESLLSVMDVCDELVVSYAVDSDDASTAALADLAARHPKLRLFSTEIWTTPRTGGETIRLAAEEAMAACSGDWRWHVQADEVYTRAEAKKVRELVDIYHNQPVHGFRFQVLHFYGDYDTVIDPSARAIGWYQQTIRLARAGQARHFDDAWTLVLAQNNQSSVQDVDVRIFHYGHVRENEAMRSKSNYMERLYHVLPDSFEVCPPGEFVYDRVPPQYLRRFGLSHPEAMQIRIARWRTRTALAHRPAKPRLLVVSRFHKVKKGFGITLNEIYATGHLQQHFEVQQLAWHYEAEPQTIDGVEVWPCPEDKHLESLRERLFQFEPDVILLHADAYFFVKYLPELNSWRGPVVGWFTIDYER
ncbi:MAG: glycosyltransferase, partial [Candidatus Sericytochromatia bacterium]